MGAAAVFFSTISAPLFYPHTTLFNHEQAKPALYSVRCVNE
ncbi:hypothetical protein APS_1783 [Acetobacter pasteurianus subsp. pasteurianus LMG 1262 = NBRC 106471]|nr:hypothetical protein APS_1783 [Acetobacter pasteurianus subsp. pasteurianus LMG 1262 = NBRC 106471]